MKKFFFFLTVFLNIALFAAPQTTQSSTSVPEPPKDTFDMELNRGRTALIKKEFKEAEEFFVKAEKLASFPWQHTRIRYCRAASLALQKKYKEARALLKEKIPSNQRSDYNTAFCALMCGEYAAAEGKLKMAEIEWKAALDSAPHNWIESRAMLRLGQAAEERRDYKAAYSWYDKMKKREHALPAARSKGYMMTALLNAKLKKFDEAYAELNAAEQIHQLRPDMLAGIAMLRADLLTKQSRHKESHEEVLRALKIKDLTAPPQVMLLCRSAKAELEFKHYKAALETIRRAKRIRAAQKFFEPELEKEIERAYSDFQRRSKLNLKNNKRK